ncbi:hypothetical protein G5I_03089 [Acromyrmex echinatior]|uniref:Uncharacterized protein n=1 Tax=Acromyrmex echinatior TaxID=103372 RepID=F4WC17_ACREC|nr:hypothetical protein G5I_03089 [Acromyrmex echinatior]
MADYHADVEDIDGSSRISETLRTESTEHVRNVDEEQFANIRDEVFEMFDEMEVDFENIMDQESSDEEMLSNDSGCASDMNEYEMDRVKKFVLSPEIRRLNLY